MKKIAIIILNYLNYEDTLECIESLKNDFYTDREIIVIDNGSENESYEVLNRHFGDKIHLIKNDKNLGFAAGNNRGILYAREILKCSFVLLVNNDTVFKDPMLITEMINAYEKNVAVIGPRIIERNNLEQNPVPIIVDKKNAQKRYNNLVGKNHTKSKKLFKYLKNIRLLRKIKNLIIKTNKYPYNSVQDNICSENLVLHGACMMLTNDYFKFYDKLFPNTFLYYEENILNLLIKKVGLRNKYINNVFIYHKEDMSSTMSFNNSNTIKMQYELDSVKKCIQLFDMSYEEIKKKFFES
jgi:GT2 family glycosyltransferase